MGWGPLPSRENAWLGNAWGVMSQHTAGDLGRYIERLTISQGAGLAEPFALLPWEGRFVRGAFRRGIQTAALTVARGNGKSTLASAIAAASVDGPLAQHRAEALARRPIETCRSAGRRSGAVLGRG